MNVGRLKQLLKKLDDNLDVRIDNDENGFYSLMAIEVHTDATDDDNCFLNLISSNET